MCRAPHVVIGDVSSCEVGTTKVSCIQIDAGKACLPEVAAVAFRAKHTGPIEICATEVDALQITVSQISTFDDLSGKVCVAKINLVQIRSGISINKHLAVLVLDQHAMVPSPMPAAGSSASPGWRMRGRGAGHCVRRSGRS